MTGGVCTLLLLKLSGKKNWLDKKNSNVYTLAKIVILQVRELLPIS